MLLKKCKQGSFWSKNMMRECIRTLPREGMQQVVQCTMTTKRFFSKAKGNLEVGGDVQPNISRLEAVYGHSLIINPYQGMYQEIHPYRAGSIDSVKINTSLLMMREWFIMSVTKNWGTPKSGVRSLGSGGLRRWPDDFTALQTANCLLFCAIFAVFCSLTRTTHMI